MAKRLGETKGTRAEIASRVGLGRQTLYQLKDSPAGVAFRNVVGISRELGIDLAGEVLDAERKPPVADWIQVRGPKGRPLDVVAVPKVGFRVAAGFAAFPQPEEDEPGLYSFRPEFIRHVLGGLPKNPDSTWGKLACVQLRRDAWSMYPTIRPGAVVLVKMGVVTSPRDVKARRIYLVDEPGNGDENGIVVKRVTFSETAGRGVLVLESDNREAKTEYAPRVIDLTDRDVSSVVRGKVVWWSVSAEEAER